MEQLNSNRTLTEILQNINDLTPQLVDSVNPRDGEEQRKAFLSGEVAQPNHDYHSLSEIDFEAVDTELERLGDEVQEHPALNPKYATNYKEFILFRRNINRLLYCAAVINSEEDQAKKTEAEQEYMALNEELYGPFDTETYISILASKLNGINVDSQDMQATKLFSELKEMLPPEVLSNPGIVFQPSEETFRAVQHAATSLYENLTRHIVDRREPYEAHEIKDLLETIISEEFGSSAEDWKVVFTEKRALMVSASKREIHVYKNMQASANKLRGNVVHELGVHMLRAVRGSDLDMLPMEIGMAGYQAAEEGLGMVMEEAAKGKSELAGTGHYTTVGLMKAGYDFRKTFDVKWRLQALSKYEQGEDITEDAITEAKDVAYSLVMRIARGTDKLPLLKDLSYYNGAKAMWEYFEKYAGDELMLNLALLGKIDPSKAENIRTALEARPKATNEASA